MKRIAIAASVVLLSATAAFAGETRRYLVATHGPAREAASTLRAEPGGSILDRRPVKEFRIVDAFAADLTEAEAAALRTSPGVRRVEPVVERTLQAIDVTTPGMQTIPYGLRAANAQYAWEGRRSDVVVHVAVMDSGVDYRHPDLADAWAGGYDVFDPQGTALDEIGHGTHVAGTVGARNNNFGVAGVAPNVRLWGVKVVDETGRGTMEDLLLGLDWVLQKKRELGGLWVVNMSLGGKEASPTEQEGFDRLRDEGLILVSSSGNDSTSSTPAPIRFPAAYPGVIAVGAIDDKNRIAKFSNSGPELSFVAAGVEVLSTTLPGDAFGSYVRVSDNVLRAKHLVGATLAGVTAPYIYCGLGGAGDFPSSVEGKIALVQRGGDTFADKARRAKEAGAVAVAIFNHNETNLTWTLYPPEDPDAQKYPWPIVVALSKADGERLAERPGVMTIGYEPDDYDDRTGTSMAAPHVAGAVAMLWSLAPDASPDAIYTALMMTAKDLGDTGKDPFYGHGAIDVNAAARLLAPEAFAGRTTGRRILKRGKG